MATISPQPKFRAFDSNGDPLSGGLLYTYEAGTTTPKATFTTEEGDVSNANPVVLDSDGYADVWLGDGGYKFVLKTSADVTIWTVDDLGGASSIAFGASVNTITTNTAVTALYANSVNICTTSPTLSLLSVASAGEGFYFTVKNNGSGTVTIDPDASETIDGASTLDIAAGSSALIICNGTTWYSLFLSSDNFSDSDFRIQDNSDATKQIAFEASTITTGTTRTITVPDASGTLLYVGDVLDEDDFATDSAVYPPSQQSTKAYIDAKPVPIGESQTWTDVSGSRALDTVYTNSTGRPIQVMATIGLLSSSRTRLKIDGVVVSNTQTGSQTAFDYFYSFIIPNGVTYEIEDVSGSVTIDYWWELR